jgi:lipoate-protein ligase B
MVCKLGKVDYSKAAALQVRLAGEVAAGESLPTLLLLQHPHVYTLGRQTDPTNLLWDQAEMERRGIQLVESDRGGDITYHGPGQLVGYPILPLGDLGTLKYLRKLEEALIRSLAEFHIEAIRLPGQTGVWVPGQPPAKIASIGVRVDANRVTRHGFAVNHSVDMAFWGGMVACGLENQAKANLSDLLPDPPPMDSFQAQVITSFVEVFEVTPVGCQSAQI